MKTVLVFFSLLLIPILLQATVILDEPFDYPDGALIQVSNSQWVHHSGNTSNEVDVSNGKVNLSQAESEDVHCLLNGFPYTNITVYLSFYVNFTSLSGTGDYFLHLKTEGMNFRAKVFATTRGAATGKFRLGISNSDNNFSTIPSDLALNTEYKVVVKYNCATAESVIWLNPISEISTINRADAIDSTTPTSIYAVSLRQSSGIGILTIDNLKIGDKFTDIAGSQSVTNPPSISAIGDINVPANTIIESVLFTVFDNETPSEQLVVTTTSDNQILIPDNNITISGTSSEKTLKITTVENQQGTALISVMVRDVDNNVAITSFHITVGAPTISSIPNQIIQKNKSTADLPFIIFDNETNPENLTLLALSSDKSIVSPSGCLFGGSGSNRTVRITPMQDAVGTTTIYLIVSDGINYATNNFKLTVAQPGALELYEPFDYPDGALQETSSYKWFRHSGTASETQVFAGKALLNQTNTEDLSIYLYNVPPIGY
ncbi:MAG TPA: hypothetical protein PLW02_08530, partial [Verrucomicrobiota bacterium]|nr:hypothetical protein [Verrucomicrobiota bacterium]